MAQGRKYPDEFAAQVMAECLFASDIGKVLKHHKIASRTYTNWQARVKTDPNFAELCRAKRRIYELEWRRFARSSLRAAFKKAEVLIEACTQPSDLEHLNDFIRTVGDLAVSIEVLEDDNEPQTRPIRA